MRQLLVIEQHIAVPRGFQLLAGAEMVALQHLFDPTVGLRVAGWAEAVFDADVGAEPVERVLAAGAALAQAEQAVGEFAAIVGQ